MRRRMVQPEILSFVWLLRSPVTPFDRSDEECELFRRVQRIWQRKVWTQCHSRGDYEKEVRIFGKEKCKTLRQYQGALHILARKSEKLIANFSATKVTSLPSLSLSLSLSHRAHLTHNIGSASALPIIFHRSSHSLPRRCIRRNVGEVLSVICSRYPFVSLIKYNL